MRKAVLSLAMAVAALGLGNATRAADWPAFRGPDANNISTEKGLNQDWKAKAPQTLWKVAMADDGFSGPAVVKGRVYIMDHEGTQDIIRCLDAKTGEEKWRFAFESPAKANWGLTRSTPAVDDGHVYALSQTGIVQCVDAETGKSVWSVNMVQQFGGKGPNWYYASSPLVDGDRVIVLPGGGSAAVALNKKTGKVIWKAPSNGGSGYSTPVLATIDGKKQYVVFSAAGATGVDWTNGQFLWTYEWKTSNDVNAATPIVMGNRVFLTSNYKRGCTVFEVKGNQATKVWENKEMHSHFTTPLFVDGMIYGTTDPGDLVCLDPSNGEVKWRQKGGWGKGGLTGVDGMMLALTGDKGELVMVKLTPDAYTELGRITPLGERSWTSPVVADGVVFVRNPKSLAAVDLK